VFIIWFGMIPAHCGLLDDGNVRLWRVSLFVHPYAALCAYVGPPTPQEWDQYAPGEAQPKACG
jgi:hypothetical protein